MKAEHRKELETNTLAEGMGQMVRRMKEGLIEETRYLRNPLDVEPTVSPGARRATLFSRGGVPVTLDDPAPRPRVQRAAAPPPLPPPPPP